MTTYFRKFIAQNRSAKWTEIHGSFWSLAFSTQKKTMNTAPYVSASITPQRHAPITQKPVTQTLIQHAGGGTSVIVTSQHANTSTNAWIAGRITRSVYAPKPQRVPAIIHTRHVTYSTNCLSRRAFRWCL